MNKPVAWMELYYGEPNNLSWTDDELRDSGEVYKTIPLYTHPVKELTKAEGFALTDEEIKQVWSGIKWNGSDPIELTFAKAILRKAQEK